MKLLIIASVLLLTGCSTGRYYSTDNNSCYGLQGIALEDCLLRNR